MKIENVYQEPPPVVLRIEMTEDEAIECRNQIPQLWAALHRTGDPMYNLIQSIVEAIHRRTG